MKKSKTIFDIMKKEDSQNISTFPTNSNYFSKEEDYNEEEKESYISSSFNFFKESKLSGDEYYFEESDNDDKSSFVSKNEIENIYNNVSTYRESDFTKISRLGNGSYGEAFKIKHNETNKIYALKEINKSKLIKENKLYQIKIENDMLKLCSHPNIVKYYGFYENKINFSIIEEYCPYGDLSSFINENKQKLSLIEIQFIIGQILICLEYLATKNIIHRDIKPENFLISDNFQLKLIDFGTATILGKIFDAETKQFVNDNNKILKKTCDSFLISHNLEEEQQSIPNNKPYSSFKYQKSDIFQIMAHSFKETEDNNSINKLEDIKRQKFVGTAEYMAPEIINSKKTGYYTDIWSMICILYLCLTGHTPFTDKTEYLIFQNITHLKYNQKYINLIPKEALDLIINFFKNEPSERIGYKGENDFDFNTIKSHPFFILKEDNIDISKLKEQLMNKCSYYKKILEKRNKGKNSNNDNIKDKINENNQNKNDKNFNDNEEDINNKENGSNGRVLKIGLLKKQSPYFYYDLRKVILYDTPRIEYIDPDKSLLKGTIILSKECSAQLIKTNQFKLITPKRTFIFMCKERYDINPWVIAINKAIDKYS